MRCLVGPTDESAFDNPSGELIFPQLQPDSFETVLDFGCGCGRLARQLLQQRYRPKRYLGLDLHRGMIEWCVANLSPFGSDFTFAHHDVYEMDFNPDSPHRVLPFPCNDSEFTLAIALSVFTHLIEEQVGHYLRELRRILRPDGVAYTTWFVFDKSLFPMMQEEQNALYINPINPTNAAIFDRNWIEEQLEDADLLPLFIKRPLVRGFQWDILLTPIGTGHPPALWPEDDAPIGVLRASDAGPNPHLVGLDIVR
jgi:SAM-dependent methyltransferase